MNSSNKFVEVLSKSREKEELKELRSQCEQLKELKSPDVFDEGE